MAKSIFGLFKTRTEVEEQPPLASVKAIGKWLATLSPNDPIGAVAAMVRLLEETCATQPASSVDRTLALMEMDRWSLSLQAQLQAQYRTPTLSEEVRQTLWHGRNDLARWLALAYEQIQEGSRIEPVDPNLRSHLHGVFSRMFHYRGKQALQGLIRYEQWIPARWKALHVAYRSASEQGLAGMPFSLVENPKPGERFSAEQEYLQLLLLQRINSGNLTVPQIELAAQWVRDMVPALKLDTTAPRGKSHWLLDLDKTEGLSAASKAAPTNDLLYLDVGPMRTHLHALMDTLAGQLGSAGDAGGKAEIRARLALAKRLEVLLLPNAKPQPRRGERHADQRVVLVASGWVEIPTLMRQGRPWRTYEPNKYTYDGLGGPPSSTGTEAPRKVVDGSSEHLHPEQRGWQVLDLSDSGCRLESRTRHAAQMLVGNLLVLLFDGDSRWRIGIVRRLRRRTAEHTEIGIEIITDDARLMKVDPAGTTGGDVGVSKLEIGGKGSRVFHALYVPPQQRSQVAPVRSLVVPAAEFQSGRVVALETEGQINQIRFVLTIEQTKDWVWTTFEPTGTWREVARP